MRTLCRSIGRPQLKGRIILRNAGKGGSLRMGGVDMCRLPARFLDIPLKRGFLYGGRVCKGYVYNTNVMYFFLFCYVMYKYVFNGVLNVGNGEVTGGVGVAEGKTEIKGKGAGGSWDKRK